MRRFKAMTLLLMFLLSLVLTSCYITPVPGPGPVMRPGPRPMMPPPGPFPR